MKKFLLFIVFATALAVLLFLFIGGDAGIGGFLANGNPLLAVGLVVSSLVLCSFVASLLSGDYSWVDRLWSTIPVIYVWFFAWRGAFSQELLLIAILVTLWGIRLSWNFGKKGGYSGEEDYRWSVLRAKITIPVLWQIFNFLFICTFQLALIAMFTVPAALLIGTSAKNGSGLIFWIGIALMLGSLILETIADNQQWDYYKTRSAFRAGKDISKLPFAMDAEQGFLSSGLFRYSRHPNYLGEQGFWLGLYVAVSGHLTNFWHIGLIGISLLIILFMGSSNFSENISKSKYPTYVDYQKSTSRFIPWFSKAKKKVKA